MRELPELAGAAYGHGRLLARLSVHPSRVRVDVHPASENARTDRLCAAMDLRDHELESEDAFDRVDAGVASPRTPLTSEDAMS